MLAYHFQKGLERYYRKIASVILYPTRLIKLIFGGSGVLLAHGVKSWPDTYDLGHYSLLMSSFKL